ncbi:TolC family protein [Nemorincola caseinilytica]|uniref:TolC family protein n=1 Tax=Nemorincola caseinilytica TaxID=2054315 RepID=A0ABP8N4D2_9BACT
MKHEQKINLLAAAILAMAAIAPAQAQKTRSLSLNEAIELSLQNSGKMKIAYAKADEANAGLHEAKDRRLPDLKVQGAYMRLNTPDVTLKLNTGSSQQQGGGEQSGGGTPKVDQVAYGMATATLPLFSGFRIKYGIESARYLEIAARLDAEKDREEVIQNTIEAYLNLYKAKRSVELVKENLQREEKRVKDFGNLEQNGLMARNDLLKAQLQQSNVELALMEAENNLKITNINMALQLGLPEDSDLIPDSTGMEATPEAGSVAQWEQIALEQRKDRAALNARINAANMGIKATKGEYLPSVALTGGYIGADVPNLLTIPNAFNAGIGLQYNIAALWKTGAKLDAAKARLHQAQATEGIIADQVRLEVHHAYQGYLLSLKKITVYKKSIEQANENFRITKNKYDNNLVTTTDLLDADVAQLQAQLNYAFSRADAMLAYKKLQRAAGVLGSNN